MAIRKYCTVCGKLHEIGMTCRSKQNWKPSPKRRVKANNSSAVWKLRRQIKSGVAFCAACRACNELQIDHRVPLHKGGDDSEANLQILCGSCHKLKTLKERRDRAKADIPLFIV